MGKFDLKGLCKVLVKKGGDRVADVVELNEKVLSNWQIVYDYLRLLTVSVVFRPNISETCG